MNVEEGDLAHEQAVDVGQPVGGRGRGRGRLRVRARARVRLRLWLRV